MEIEHRLPSVDEYRKLRGSVGWRDTDENATKIAFGFEARKAEAPGMYQVI
jgi:hypothetical protein